MMRYLFPAFFVLIPVITGLAQTPSFSSKVESVRVDVLVMDRGRVVTGLRPGDFEVLDNGVPQKVDLASFEEIPLNVVLSLDVSGSLDVDRLAHLRSAGRTLLDGLKKTDQAALVTFSHFVFQPAPLSSDFALVRAGLERTLPSGQTSLVDATFTGMMIGESDVGRSLLLIFSDGVDTTSWLGADAVLDTAKRCDVVVYGVEIGNRRSSFLKDVSDTTGGRSIQVESTRDLSTTFGRILEEFRQRYLISYSPEGVTSSGWHSLQVRVNGRNLTVRARPGYLAGN
jgi:VWFA-related protein